MQTITAYDIGDDRLRRRIEIACRDLGMQRIQNSAFLGELNDQQRQRLRDKIHQLVKNHKPPAPPPGQKAPALHIQIFPLCAADFAKAITINKNGCHPTEPVQLPKILII